MNERIMELAIQAGFENGHQDRDGRSLSSELEKFAELIVKECCEISDEAERTDQPVLASKFIKAHFGLEE